MKKLLFIPVLIGFLVLPLLNCQAITEIVAAPEKDPFNIIKRVVDIIFAFLLAFAVVVIIIGGFNFLTAAGEPEKVKSARNYIIYALIAVVVGFAARGLVSLADRVLRGV